MAEWNMAPASTISNKGFTAWQVPIDITLLSEKLFAVLSGLTRLSQAVGSDPRVE